MSLYLYLHIILIYMSGATQSVRFSYCCTSQRRSTSLGSEVILQIISTYKQLQYFIFVSKQFSVLVLDYFVSKTSLTLYPHVKNKDVKECCKGMDEKFQVDLMMSTLFSGVVFRGNNPLDPAGVIAARELEREYIYLWINGAMNL